MIALIIFVLIFICTCIVYFFVLPVAHPRGYLTKADMRYRIDKLAFWKANKVPAPRYECYGERHWSKPQGFNNSQSGYFSGLSLDGFKAADEAYRKEHGYEKETD